jgi:hypothetical protein
VKYQYNREKGQTIIKRTANNSINLTRDKPGGFSKLIARAGYAKR